MDTTSEFQGIDLPRIKTFFTRTTPDSAEFDAIRPAVLELLEHVESQDVLGSIETARLEIAYSDDPEAAMPSVY